MAATPIDHKSFVRRHAVKLVASALITVGLLITLQQADMKLVPSRDDLANVHWWAIAAYVPLWLGLTWFRSVRWRFLLRSIVDIPKLRLFAVSCVGFASILLFPFRLGELVRPYMLKSRPDDVLAPGAKPLTMTAATSSVVAERVIDGLFLSIVLAVVLLTVPTVQPLPEQVVGVPISTAHVRDTAFLLLGIFTAAFITIGVFYFAREWAHTFTMAVVGVVSKSLAAKIAGIAEKLADGLHVFGRASELFGFLAETGAYWGLNALSMWVLAYGCGIAHGDGSAITFAESCGLMGMLGCAILIPGPPGLLGVFQAGIYAGMTFYFPTALINHQGAAYVFLLYIVQVIMHLVTGAWGLHHEGGRRRLSGALSDDLPDAASATAGAAEPA